MGEPVASAAISLEQTIQFRAGCAWFCSIRRIFAADASWAYRLGAASGPGVPTERGLAGEGDDGMVYVWDAADGTLLQQLAGHHSMITSVA
ncbi:MAG: hypothetical protein ABIV47_21045 [Roseiflexaceae bacterium]